MNYKEFIDDIINTRGRYGCGEEYHERHHIVPRCLGGTDEKENLVDLYAREHFIAHKLLAKENPHNQGLQCAWWMMSNMGRENGGSHRCTSEEYEEARIAFSNSQKGENNFMYGKVGYNYGKRLSEETKKKISESHKGFKMSEETKQKLSKTNTGENNTMYHKHHTEETRKIMSEKKIGKYDGENNPHWESIIPKKPSKDCLKREGVVTTQKPKRFIVKSLICSSTLLKKLRIMWGLKVAFYNVAIPNISEKLREGTHKQKKNFIGLL